MSPKTPEDAMLSQYGLAWKESLIGSEPHWTVEPDVTVVARLAYRSLELSESDMMQSTAKLEFQGAFNKLYAVECPKGRYFMRVSLPVDPQFKTLSEVATLKLVKARTRIPVPEVVAYDGDAGNELRFEWILMERVEGKTLNALWAGLTWEKKCTLVDQVVEWLAQLQNLKFEKIGNVYLPQDDRRRDLDNQLTHHGLPPPDDKYHVGRIVSMFFFWGDRLAMKISHGPFPTNRAWLKARLEIISVEMDQKLEDKSLDEDDIECILRCQAIIARLKLHLDTVFPRTSTKEQFALHHDDISAENLLVDGSSALKTLLDWECVSAMPMWKVCQLPTFLRGCERHDKPDRVTYAPDQDPEHDLYAEHVEDYEKTILRQRFLDRMREVSPSWVEIHLASGLKLDFDLAISQCDNEFCYKRIERWLDLLDQGIIDGAEYCSLEKSFAG